MKKKILAGVMLATMIFSLTACGGSEGAKNNKVAENDFEKTLDVYSTYYKEEINPNDSSDFGVSITLDKHGMPVMIVAEISENSVNSTIYVAENGKVEAIKDFRKTDDAIYTYMDGIIRVDTGSNEYEYYQLDGSKLISIDDVINNAYNNWNSEISAEFKSNIGDELSYEYLCMLGTSVGSEVFHIGDDDTSEFTFEQVSSNVSELYELVYKEIYTGDVNFSAYNSLLELDVCNNGDDGHVLSSPLLSFGEMYELTSSDFQYYIRALKEKGSMNWEDYYVWHWNWFVAESDDISRFEKLDMEDVIQRDISLMDKLDVFKKQEDSDELNDYKTAIVLYAIYNKQFDLLDSIELTKKMTPSEVLDAINVNGEFYNNAVQSIDSTGQTLSSIIGFDNFYGSDGSQSEEAKVLKEYMENNIVKSTKTETLKAFYEFVQNSSEVLASLPKEPAWKEIYTSFLKKHTSEIGRCALAYLNDDNIPELFICSEATPSHGRGVKIYTISGEEVKQLGTQEYGSNGSVNVFEKTGIIRTEFVGMGEDNISYFKMNNNNDFEKLGNLLITDFDSSDETKIKYYLDGTEITKEQWENKDKELMPQDVYGDLVPNDSLTAEQLIEKIANMQ